MSALGRSQALIPEREARRVVQSTRPATPKGFFPACEARRVLQ